MVMDIFEVEGNRIVAWRDYYDVRNAEKWATS
jgi:limonene-1,2-epoxide hydrolase